MFSDAFLSCMAGFINYSKAIPSFPDELRSTAVMSVYKKYDHLNKENNCLIGLLSHISKIVEKIIFS